MHVRQVSNGIDHTFNPLHIISHANAQIRPKLNLSSTYPLNRDDSLSIKPLEGKSRSLIRGHDSIKSVSMHLYASATKYSHFKNEIKRIREEIEMNYFQPMYSY